MTSDRLLRLAKVGDDSDACLGTNDDAFAEAEGRPRLALLRHTEEPDGLSVGANQIDAVDVDVVFIAELIDNIVEHLTQLDVRLGHGTWRRSRLAQHLQNGLLHLLRDRDLIVLVADSLLNTVVRSRVHAKGGIL